MTCGMSYVCDYAIAVRELLPVPHSVGRVKASPQPFHSTRGEDFPLWLLATSDSWSASWCVQCGVCTHDRKRKISVPTLGAFVYGGPLWRLGVIQVGGYI